MTDAFGRLRSAGSPRKCRCHFTYAHLLPDIALDAFRFPRSYVATSRIRPPAVGHDRRVVASRAPVAPDVDGGLTWEEVEADMWIKDDVERLLTHEREILVELDQYAEQMAVLDDTGWFYDDADDLPGASRC